MAGGVGGSRGGTSGRLRASARHDADASSSGRVVVPSRSRQARDRGGLSWSSGQNPWVGFDVLNEHILPHIKRCHAADVELVAAERAVANGEEGAVNRLAAAKNEHELSTALRKTAVKYYLGIDE